MIKRGKEEADALSSHIPLFQKKLKDPQRMGHGAIKATTKFDYSQAKSTRAQKLIEETQKLRQQDQQEMDSQAAFPIDVQMAEEDGMFSTGNFQGMQEMEAEQNMDGTTKLFDTMSRTQDNQNQQHARTTGQGRIISENEEKLRLAIQENEALERLYSQKQVDQERINFKY